jgi:hypothetical protein
MKTRRTISYAFSTAILSLSFAYTNNSAAAKTVQILCEGNFVPIAFSIDYEARAVTGLMLDKPYTVRAQITDQTIQWNTPTTHLLWTLNRVTGQVNVNAGNPQLTGWCHEAKKKF